MLVISELRVKNVCRKGGVVHITPFKPLFSLSQTLFSNLTDIALHSFLHNMLTIIGINITTSLLGAKQSIQYGNS